MPQAKHLPLRAKNHLLGGHIARQAHAVYAHTVQLAAAAARQTLKLLRAALGQRLPLRRQHFQRGHRRAARRVQFLVVVAFNHLHMRQIFHRLAGKTHQQHRSQRKVGGDKHRRIKLRAPFGNLLVIGLRKTSGAHHRRRMQLQASADILHHRSRAGKINHHIRLFAPDGRRQILLLLQAQLPQAAKQTVIHRGRFSIHRRRQAHIFPAAQAQSQGPSHTARRTVHQKTNLLHQNFSPSKFRERPQL